MKYIMHNKLVNLGGEVTMPVRQTISPHVNGGLIDPVKSAQKKSERTQVSVSGNFLYDTKK